MTTYLFKVILCSALFLFTYRLMLEKERMHIFKRFYLLLSLPLSFLFPFVTLSLSKTLLSSSEDKIINSNIWQDNGSVETISTVQSISYIFLIVVTIYVTITAILFYRFIVNIVKILSTAWTHQTIPYKSTKIVLIRDDITPHSIFNYIFINSMEYKSGKIENEILTHEYVHFQQKHSYDILFIEIMQTFFWFNPFIIFYKKAIQLNHEFLADEAVINTFKNISRYQYLLIDNAGKQKACGLSSQFNYPTIKKRLLMMTKTKSLSIILCKQVAVIPVLAVSLLLFSTKSFAQDSIDVPKAKQNIIPSTQDGVTQELMDEYELIVKRNQNKYKVPGYLKFSDEDITRLKAIYLSMSKEQQTKQSIIFIPALPPFSKVVPTQAQVESWKNPKIYGLWINNRRVSNKELDNYKNTDFAHVFVSKLGKNTVNYGKHYFQVNLMTIKEYENYFRKTMEAKDEYYMSFRLIKNEPSVGK